MGKRFQIGVVFLLVSSIAFAQGPFAPAADSVGSTAIYKDSNIIVGWVNNCTVTRGYQNILNSSGPLANVGDASSAHGKADGAVVSLGDGGSAMITLDQPISNHDGYDFAVFENGLFDFVNQGYFLELAQVAVSSNGIDFYTFQNQSLTNTDTQINTFATVDPTQIYGLAGKYVTSYGTPFDLSELDTVSGLSIMNITHIKITDVVGSIDANYGTYDSFGRLINDPWPTEFGSCGFDLDAVALIDSSLVSSISEQEKLTISTYPNPVSTVLFLEGVPQAGEVQVALFDTRGKQINLSINSDYSVEMHAFPKGIYVLVVTIDGIQYTRKIIKI